MDAGILQERQGGPAVLFAGFLWGAAYLAALFLPRFFGFAPWLRLAITLLPVPAFAYFLFVEIKAMQRLDELQQRIQMEALAIAFPFAILLLMTLGLLERAVELPAGDWSYRHVWPMLVVVYFGALAVVRRRYS